MKMNRRNVLVGLGTVVAGGGAALGTGAFSSVEADRTVTIETADDSEALLGIDVDEAISGDGDTATVDLSGDNLTDAEGLNIDATTTFNEALTITNQGSNDVTSLEFDVDDLSGVDEVDRVDFTIADGETEPAAGGDELSSNSSVDYDLEIETTEDATDTWNFDVTVTITAGTD